MENSKGSVLRRLREAKAMSQRVLSERSGISRGRLRRLEERGFEQITFRELRRIAQALGVDLAEIFQKEGISPNGAYLSHVGEIAFQVDARSVGYRIVSFVPPQREFFTGKLFVAPHQRLSPLHTPRAKIIFLEMLFGTLRVALEGETHEIQEGDRLLFHGETPYTIENLSLREAVAFLVTSPAFTP